MNMTLPTLDQVATLEGAELDYWTGIAVDFYVEIATIPGFGTRCFWSKGLPDPDLDHIYNPSTNWKYCGPLIEQFSICFDAKFVTDVVHECEAVAVSPDIAQEDSQYQDGPTPQIAICRAVVAAWIGQEQAE